MDSHPKKSALPPRMAREEYRRWAEQQPRGRFELVAGEAVAMAPERIGHVRLKGRIYQSLDSAVRRANLPCEALADGVTIEVGEDTDYEPDAVVYCGERLDSEAIAASSPLIVVEVLSPMTQSIDTGEKLAGYFRVPSIRHYLIVASRRRAIVHHRRTDDRIETRIVQTGTMVLDPPGITISVDDVYSER